MSSSRPTPTPERYQRVKHICLALMDVEPEQRAELLAELCGSDSSLIAEVSSRMSGIEASDGFLEWPFSSTLPPPAPIAGTYIAQYALEAEAGRGGIGIVFRARDTKLDRLVALKYLPKVDIEGSTLLNSALEEARVASSLNHPNIVSIHEFGQCEGGDYIVMEYVGGGTLADVIPNRRCTLKQRISYAIQIAEALAAAHSNGILHRDLKPGNILLTRDGTVKLADFGIAQLVSSARSADTGSKSQRIVLGTTPYMSPEQVEGLSLDARSDLFSFGSVLYELITRRPAFPGRTDAAIVAAIVSSDPSPPSAIDAEVPAALDRIVRWCLAKDPTKRLHNAADVRLLLESSLETAAEAGSHVRRSTWRAAACVCLLVTVAVVAWALFRNPFERFPYPAIQRLTAEAGLNAFPSLSADGKMLTYASDRAVKGDLDIWVRHLSGLEPARLTADPADDYDPSFSDDGASIVFRSDRDGGGIYIVPTVGGRARRIARGGYRPRFSPNGEWVVLWDGDQSIGTLPGSAQIRVVSPTFGYVRDLSAGFAAARYPVWSPDGKHVLFLGRKSGATSGATQVDWWLVDIDGMQAQATGIHAYLRSQGLSPMPAEGYLYPEIWSVAGDVILFSARRGDATSVWEVPVDRDTGKLVGKPRQRTFGTNLEAQAAVASGDPSVGVAFATLTNDVDIYSLPMDTRKRLVTGDLTASTQEQSMETYPSVSLDGRYLAYISTRLGVANLWLRDVAVGTESPVVANRSPILEAYLAAGGKQLVYTQRENKTSAVYISDVATVASRRICQSCGALTHISADGEWMLLEPADLPHSIVLLNTGTGASSRILKHSDPEFVPFAARFSPDGKWIAFHARTTAKPTRQIMIAPFHKGTPDHPRDWILVTDGADLDREVCWSPDGNSLFFLSDRDGFRCIWSQTLHPQTKAPVGPPSPIYHFHHKSLSIAGVGGRPSAIGLSATHKALIFSANRMSANVWFTK